MPNLNPRENVSHDCDELFQALSCPHCQGQIALGENGIDCQGCRRNYPIFDGIPCLLKDIEDWKRNCRLGATYLFSRLQNETLEIENALKANPLLQTRERLLLLQQGKLKHLNVLADLLSPVLSGPNEVLNDFINPEKAARLAPDRYYDNVLRDWLWGKEENELSLKRVVEVLPQGTKIERLAVLGAGACRLAVDVHNHLLPKLTIAADINPLLLLTASRILRGEKIELVDFPDFPKSKDQACVFSLSQNEIPINGGDFALVFADAFAMPTSPQSMDMVLTPWFLDVVPSPPRATIEMIHSQLKQGGNWIFFGPLLLSDRPVAETLTNEELLQLVSDTGFEVTKYTYQPIPYLKSPFSAREKKEWVLSFCAKKVRPLLSSVGELSTDPEWLINSHTPIPKLDAFVTHLKMSSQYVEILSQIDGKSSLYRIVRNLKKSRAASAEEIERAVKSLLLDLIK